MQGNRSSRNLAEKLFRNLWRQISHVFWLVVLYIVEKPLTSILCIMILILVIKLIQVAIWADDYPAWVGFGAFNDDLEGPRAKTLWDWLDLLIVPLTLAAGAFLLNRWQKKREQSNLLDQQRQETLDTFFDRMSELMIKHDLKHTDDPDIRNIARTHALGVFRTLDGSRKAQALQFLYESGLIINPPIIRLNGANLSGAELDGATLANVELRGVNAKNVSLKNANLSHADMRGIVLDGAHLKDVDFLKAKLNQATFVNADMSGATFEGAELREAILLGTQYDWDQLIKAASLKYAILTNGSIYNNDSKH